ncbi:unnamed protein product [Rotaria magnacalcarata]|uniref:NAD(P)(+)--arginine ADP-ribosyltransferase n=1 Tax=Rotaria magnacalcarata TaxID=392030 RepID=A0A8S2J8Q2_9BILA|nr:unnamed protein product [Rotaria magnacalcarata]CAF3818167.1 unnamed protein product [Rotaria magnacalcarata]
MSRSNDESLFSLSKQNLLGIWYHDENISEENDELIHKMRVRLYMTFTYVRIFSGVLEFNRYLASPLIVENIFFIISSKFAKILCDIVQNRPQCRQVYNFQAIPDVINSPFPIFDDIDKLFKQIRVDLQPYLAIYKNTSIKKIQENCHRLDLPLSLNVFNSNTKQNCFRYWTKESLEFYRCQTLNILLTKLNCDYNQSLKEMIRECRNCYFGNHVETKKIDNLYHEYNADKAIIYYTRDSFLFRTISHAFRSEDIERIYKFRRSIIDLHRQLADIAQRNRPKQKKLYRGKKLRPIVLQQLKDNTGALMSVNGFLSTTYNQKMALIYAGAGQSLLGYESDKSVLFELSIDEVTDDKIFADITSISQFVQDDEVLFSVGSVWTIESVRKSDDLWWTVELKYRDKLDSELIQSVEQLSDDKTLLNLGDVLLELGQHTKAKNFFYRMLKDSTLKDETQYMIYYKIAKINMAQGEDMEALINLHKAEERLPSVAANPNLTSSQSRYAPGIIQSPLFILRNIGLLYQKASECDKALKYLMDAASIEDSDSADRAIIEDDIALLYYSEGDYAAALKHSSNAIELSKANHCANCLTKFKQNYETINQHLLSSHCDNVSK